MIDTNALSNKLARNDPWDRRECRELLQELRDLRVTAAWLADCHAASLQALPRSASKSARSRHMLICERAEAALRHGVVPTTGSDPEQAIRNAVDRCSKAVAKYRQESV